MKTNKMMRLASVLLVAVLLSTCAISGTFAKYVTTAEATDSARVAHWGIQMANTGSGFKANYNDTVVAYNATDKIAAPGTNGTASYTVTGAPETDYKVTFAALPGANEIYLGEGTYTYGSQYVGMNATLATDEKYYPIEWSVTLTSTAGTITGFTSGTAQTFSTLNAALTALNAASVTYDANEACDLSVVIAWEWDFDTATPGSIINADYASNDVYDTILGDISAGNAALNVSAGAQFNTTVEFTVRMTATQID